MRRASDADHPTPGSPLAPYAQPAHLPAGPFGAAPAPTIPAASGLPTLVGLINALKRRWVLASFLGLLVGLAAAAGVWLAYPAGKHSVQALLEMTADNGVVDKNSSDSNFEGYKKNQEVLIKTRTILGKVVKNRQVAELAFIKNNDDPVKWIEEKLKTSWKAPDVMEVSMNGDNPEQLRVILEAVVQEYVRESSNTQKGQRQERIRLLEKAQEEIGKEIKMHEYMIQSASKEGIMTADEANGAVQARLQNQLTSFDQRIDEVSSKIRNYEAQITEAERQSKAAEVAPIPVHLVDAELEKNADIKALKYEADGEQLGLDELTARLEDKTSPLISSKKRRVAEAQRKLEAAKDAQRAAVDKRLRAEKKQKVDEQLDLLRQDLNVQRVLLEGLNKLRIELEQKTTRLAMKSSNVTLDADNLKPLRDQFAYVKKQILDQRLLASGGGRVHVREEPTVIMNFNLKQKMMFSAAVAVVGFIGIMVLVSYLEWRSRRVDSVDQVVGELGMRVIGTIPAFPSRASLKAGEADQNQNWRFILNESVNSTRTMLLHTAKTQSMQVIMVTSAMQGEGKTSLSSQLATSMATAGLRTLILDCDLRNPSMHRLFDVPLVPGCSEILCSEVDVSDAVQPTSVPNLWMIPAGQCSNRVISALAQGHPLETLFNRLRGQFDFIVVDSCPVLPVADALLIGQHVDGAVISILQDISQLPKVLNASERLTQLNIPLVGAVVNGIKTDVHAYGYNYVKQLPA